MNDPQIHETVHDDSAADFSNHPAKYWHKQPDGKFLCNLCPRQCLLKPNQRGFCFMRKATETGIVLTSYGYSSGFCIDPIEKKPLNHFYPGTSVFSFGTVGCNLGCQFCQNWDISKVRKQARLLDQASPQQIAAEAKRTGCRSVAFTYNDPIPFAEYAIDTAHEARKLGLKTVAVTNGYISEEARGDFFGAMDAANIDLKGFTEEFYKKRCLAELAPILDTLKYVRHKTNTWLEITTLLIPGENDSPDEVKKLSLWIRDELGDDVPLHFTAFHPDFRMMDIPPTPPETLIRSRAIAMGLGLKFVYTGNIHDPEGASTYCPKCKDLLLERDWYKLGRFYIQSGRCGKCNTPIPGHFEDKIGDWGPKRMAVKFS